MQLWQVHLQTLFMHRPKEERLAKFNLITPHVWLHAGDDIKVQLEV